MLKRLPKHLKTKNAVLPDSLQKYNTIQVPLQSIVVTSTTIIPYLELLELRTDWLGFIPTFFV
jgi:iron complex transport system substrate-binding protein